MLSFFMTGETMEKIYDDILSRLRNNPDIGKDELEDIKLEVCSKHSAPEVPNNPELLKQFSDKEAEQFKELLQRKPVRTASGVSPVAIMTSPKMCPHGKCLYCPGGPASEFSSSQAYTGKEPAARRAKQNDYDPYGQVTLRLEQLRHIGHPVDKVELILMGGTMTSRSHDYQEWFVKRALEAMNQYDTESEPQPSEARNFSQKPDEYEFKYLENVKKRNETADVRCIGITFETKPDWCGEEQINRMLRLGGTKVEIGVQTTHNKINRKMHRGHGTQASKDANKRLRDAGFKVGFHMMPGQPGMSHEMNLKDFERIFTKNEWKPDYLKIYPTLVVKGTKVYDMWEKEEYNPLNNEEAAELVAKIKSIIPRYTRLQRVQRDIPADYIEGGVWKSNLRQLAHEKMNEHGWECDCIRCREVGMNNTSPIEPELRTMEYESCGGTEHFISIEDFDKNILIGFCRLRFPDNPNRQELTNSSIIRELHVYGNEAGIGSDKGEYQHEGRGKELIKKAEQISRDNGFGNIRVISGIGAREYYKKKFNYEQIGPYVGKTL